MLGGNIIIYYQRRCSSTPGLKDLVVVLLELTSHRESAGQPYSCLNSHTLRLCNNLMVTLYCLTTCGAHSHRYIRRISLYVPGLEQTSATMALHSFLSPARRKSSGVVKFGIILFWMYFFRLSRYMRRCLPRPFLPEIFPVKMRCSMDCFLKIWPKNFICFSLMVGMSDLFILARLRTFSLVILSVHEILRILRRNHISAASSFDVCALLRVQHSLPYNSTDHT